MTTYRLGLTPLADSRYPSPWFPGCSQLFVCPVCGSAWGSIEDQGEWVPVRAGCPLHPWPYTDHPGGTFLPPWPLRFDQWSFIPRAVLEREFSIHLAHRSSS